MDAPVFHSPQPVPISPMTTPPWIESLRLRMQKGLPGRSAQRKMAPAGRPLPKTFSLPKGTRKGSVLALLYPRADQIHIVLTKRSLSLGNHRGQISFPGGAGEDGESSVETALREAQEEVGVAIQEVEVLGELSDLYIPASGFWVLPQVGWMRFAPEFIIEPKEVESLIEVPLAHLMDDHQIRREPWIMKGRSVEVPFYALGPYKVWGATAMILAELVSLSQEVGEPSLD